MPPTSDKPGTLFLCLLAALNAALVVGGGAVLTGGSVDRVEAVASERFAADMDARAAAMASGVMPYAANVPMLREKAFALAPKDAVWEVAGEAGGVATVVAASDPKRVGQAPDGALRKALVSPDIEGAFEGMADGAPGDRYVTYHLVPLMPAVAATPTPAPTATPAPRAVEREVVEETPVASRTYKIRVGDTLYQISRDHYGDAHMFYAIWERNKDVIGADRSRLPVGASITLPEGKRMEKTVKTVMVTPSPAATPTPAPTPAAITRMALRLSVPVDMPAQAAGMRQKASYVVMGAAAGTVGLWAIALWWVRRRRKAALESQRQRWLGGLSRRLTPQGALPELGQLRSAFLVEYASAGAPAPESSATWSELRPLSENRVGVFLGDASGPPSAAVINRGLAAALWRAKAAASQPPSRTLLEMNAQMVDYVPQGEHVTAFYAQLDLMSGAMRYASAAHGGAYWLRASGELSLLGGRGMPLGVGQELFAGRLTEGSARVEAGDSLVFVSDGLLAIENAAGEPFGLARLEAALQAAADRDAGGIVAHLEAAIKAFAGPRAPEAAIACLRLGARSGRARTGDAMSAPGPKT